MRLYRYTIYFEAIFGTNPEDNTRRSDKTNNKEIFVQKGFFQIPNPLRLRISLFSNRQLGFTMSKRD